MNDASNFQKINSLARELMKRGQASSMDQAIRMATQQIDQGYEPSSTQPADPIPDMPEKVDLPKGTEVSADDIIAAVENLVSAQQTAVSRMTNAVNTHTQQFTDFHKMIQSLIADVTSLKDEIQRLKNSPIAPPMKPKEAQAGQTQFKQEQQPASAPKPEAKKDGSGHARTGNYNPDDVSIEKFFYYGHK